MELLYTAHVPSGAGPFPTILALHGWGASAHDLLGLAPLLHRGEALVLCPQGPVGFEIAPDQLPGQLGFGWWPLRQSRELDLTAFAHARDQLRAFLDAACQRYPVDPRKLVVLGFSQGGVLACDLVLGEPERFAGLIALSTWLPEAALRAHPECSAHQNFPALLLHGSEDPMIPVEQAQRARDALTARGLDVSYREYPMQHEINQEALIQIARWLEEKVFNLIQLL